MQAGLTQIRTGARRAGATSSNMRQILGGAVSEDAPPPPPRRKSSARSSRPGGQGEQGQAQRAGSPRLSIQSEHQPVVKRNFHYSQRNPEAHSDILGAPSPLKDELRLPPILQHSATAAAPLVSRNIEYETRIESQERMSTLVIQQVNSLERQVNSLLARQSQQSEGDRDSKRRLEGAVREAVRAAEERAQTTSSELGLRLGLLEEQLTRVQDEKAQLQQRAAQSDLRMKQVLGFVRATQQQENSEMNQVRAMVQDRLSQEQIGAVKQKEKSAALFTEVVRLGESQGKTEDQVGRLQLLVESKVETLEQRLIQSEQYIQTLEKSRETRQNISQKDLERLIIRQEELEKQLLMLNSENTKGKESLSRLEVVSLKNNEDFRGLLGSLQNQFAGRLQTQITELVGRILGEQDSRSRAIEDIRHQVELKERIAADRVRQEREQVNQRYTSMDLKVAAEFQRKDEALHTLREQLEATTRTVQGWLKQEEVTRASLEQAVRSDLNRFAEQLRLELETGKAEEKAQTEQVAMALKNEADLRQALERESKQLVQSLVASLTADFKTFKELVETAQEKLSHEVHELAQQTSDNAHFLSRYVDDEVSKAAARAKEQFDQLKKLSTQLVQNFRQHLINTERFKNETDKRLAQAEALVPQTKADLLGSLEQAEQRLVMKMGEVKALLDTTSLSNLRSLEERLHLFAGNVDSNVGLLRRAIQTNREAFVSVMNEQRDLNNTRFAAATRDLEKIAIALAEMESGLQTEKSEAKMRDEQLAQGLNELSATNYAAVAGAAGQASGARALEVWELGQRLKQAENQNKTVAKQLGALVDQTDVEKDMAGAAIKAVQEELEHNMDELKGFYKADADFKSKTEEAVQELERQAGEVLNKMGELERLEAVETAMQEQARTGEARMTAVEEDTAKRVGAVEEKVDALGASLDELVGRKVQAVKEELKRQSQKIYEERSGAKKDVGPGEVLAGRSELHSFIDDVAADGGGDSVPRPVVKKP